MFGQVPPTQFDLNFTLMGIPVRVHPIFWLTSIWLAWVPQALDVVLVRVLCIFVAILVHEMGHALVTRKFGWQPEIVLYILGGYATSTRHSTWKDIAVSAAGPASGLALFFTVWFAAQYVVREQVGTSLLLLEALRFSLFINLLWNVMNLIPVLPLDGGQISRELCCWFDPRRGMEKCLLISMIASGAVAAFSLYNLKRPGGVLGLDPLFLGIMFGYLCFQSYQSYEAQKRGYW